MNTRAQCRVVFCALFCVGAAVSADDVKSGGAILAAAEAAVAEAEGAFPTPHAVSETTSAAATAAGTAAPNEKGMVENVRPFSLEDQDVLAFYGHPKSKIMGILGRHTKEELETMLSALASSYEEAGGRPVKKAFYIIYGTVWPKGEIGYINSEVLKTYIDFAAAHDMLVIIDHQIGKYDPVDSLRKMLPYLKYPNVHLALDPEWRTETPMENIGQVSADEVNRAQTLMENYLRDNNLSGERMLVIHQFKPWMITNRAGVRTDFQNVRLIHCADGFGNPYQKRAAYAQNAEASNIPLKGFKLFYESGIKGAGFDSPLLTPEEVYALSPRPRVIMYQ